MALSHDHSLQTRAAAPELRPIFIVGAARSGTTLLRSMLSAHPRIAISPETHFMKLAEQFGVQRLDAPEDPGAFWRALEAHLDRRAIQFDARRCRALSAMRSAEDFRSIFEAVLAAQAERAGKARVGEKTPGHEHHLARLLDWFPEAQVIFVLRDPRACVASTLHTPWALEQLHPGRLTAPLVRRLRSRHIALAASEWARSHRAAQTHYADHRVTRVAYEDLVQTPEAELKRLCAFLGEHYAAEMTAQRAPALVDPAKTGIRWREWTLAHERRATMPITTAELARWRQELTDAELAMVEGTCGAGMRQLRYAFTQPAAERKAGERRGERVMRLDRAEGAAREAIGRLFGRSGRGLGLFGASIEAQAAAAGLLACGM